jgi:hypothetical protein
MLKNPTLIWSVHPSSFTASPSKSASATTTTHHRAHIPTLAAVPRMETLISSSSLLRPEGRENAAITLMAAHVKVLMRTLKTAVSSLMRLKRLERKCFNNNWTDWKNTPPRPLIRLVFLVQIDSKGSIVWNHQFADDPMDYAKHPYTNWNISSWELFSSWSF